MKSNAKKMAHNSSYRGQVNRSNTDIRHIINDSKSNESLREVNNTLSHSPQMHFGNMKNASASNLQNDRYFNDPNKSIEKSSNLLEISKMEEFNPFTTHEKITEQPDASVYEEEMLNCMRMAKQKVQNLANKLKLAKGQIIKLRKDWSEKSQLIRQYQQVNDNLLQRISAMEQEVNEETTVEKKLLSTMEIKKMIETSLNDSAYESETSFYKDKDVQSLKYRLKQLKDDDKFKHFIRLNELDPSKILSMPNEDNGILSELQKSPDRDYADHDNDSESGHAELSLEDYIKFSYIICRLLDWEEKHRLKTEEQYYQILGKSLPDF